MHLGLIGYGGIASGLLDLLPAGQIPKVTILVRPGSSAPDRFASADTGALPAVRFVTRTSDLIDAAPDLVVECAGHSAVAEHVPTLLQAGTDLIIASVGVLADAGLHRDLASAADRGASRFILPSGAIGGLDLLSALSLTGDVELRYRGTKPPAAWAGSAAGDKVDLESLQEATVFFSGNARDAALAFPKNANVVAALALAGGGFDRMQVELVADPAAHSNQHSYSVTAPQGRFEMTINAAGTASNARTSVTTILSILKEIMEYRSTQRSA